ncbi:IclR family transcriptional regulator [Actinomadura sp. 9N215]|uniref:IclR family transcriptional regulator n=1 Tax=Actinomadura sp. 9N215 TaxID=3375150 RepID=UPI0037B15503
MRRALALLGEVAEHDGIALTEAAQATGLSLSTAARLLNTLAEEGFVQRDGDRAYHAGGRLHQIAVTAMTSTPLYQLATPHLEAMRDATGESAYLGVPGPGDTVLYARIADSPQPIRHANWLGRTVPVRSTAIGAALRDQCGSSGFVSTRYTVETGVTAIAATVHWPRGGVAAAISVVGPTYRIGDDDLAGIGALVARHARELTAQLAPDA